MYSEKVMDHFSNPRNVGDMENPTAVGTVGNSKCGDIMKIYLKIENEVITDVSFKTFGQLNLLSLDFDSGVSDVNVTNRLLLFMDNLK